MPTVETGICRICLHFSFLREKRWCRPVKPSRANPHCGLAFNGSNLAVLFLQKENAHRLVCVFFLSLVYTLDITLGTLKKTVTLQNF